MIIDVTGLKSNPYIEVNNDITIDKEEFNNTDIIELKKANIRGTITKYGEDDYEEWFLDGFPHLKTFFN